MNSIENIYVKIKASVRQAIAQSGVDLSSLDHEQQERLVAKISDQLMLTMNDLLEEISPAQATVELPDQSEIDENQEKVLWQGRPFLSLVENYIVTSERIKIVQGFFSKDIENFELVRIQDIDLNRAMHERILNIGDIVIRGHDPSNPTITLRNISNPEGIYELLRRAWLEARKRHGLQFREYM